jgi:hypothetical protein
LGRQKLIRLALLLCIIAAGGWSSAGSGKSGNKKSAHPPVRTDKVPPASPLQLVDGTKTEVAFTWRELESGDAIISIWNSSEYSQDVTAEATDFSLSPGSVGAGVSALQIAISSHPGRIPAYGIGRFTLNVHEHSKSPRVRGSYGGILVVKSTSGKFSPFSQRIRINVVGPQPSVSKQTLVAWRIVPFCRLWHATVNVPLTDNYPNAEFSDQNRVVGFVHRANGGIATVRWETLKPAEANKPARAHLVVCNIPSAGQYDGDITLAGTQDKSSPLALTVLAKDIFIWPVLVMALGIFVAWKAKRYLGVLRMTWSLRQQEAELGSSFQESQKQFTASAAGKPYASYSVAEDIAAQRNQICNNLTAIERSWTTSVDNDQNYKNTVTGLQTLQDEISQWGKFGAELAGLEEALLGLKRNIDPQAVMPAIAEGDDPAFLDPVQKLLQGKILHAADIAGLRKDVSDATAFAQLWDDTNQHAKSLTVSLQDIQSRSTLDADQKATVADIEKKLVAAWQHLWTAKTLADLSVITASNGDLDLARVGLAQIATSAQRPSRFGVFALPSQMLIASDALSAAGLFTPAADLSHLPASDTRKAEMLKRAIHLGDTGTGLLAFIIALLTGLSSNYLGKPFGTLQDYAALFVWAAGTKVALDILTAALDKFGTRA